MSQAAASPAGQADGPGLGRLRESRHHGTGPRPVMDSGRIQTTSSDFGAPARGEMAVTASIRQPDPAVGLGYWPAFWMLGPGNWPGTGEIDILEDVNALNMQSGTFHCGNLTQANPDGTLGPCH